MSGTWSRKRRGAQASRMTVAPSACGPSLEDIPPLPVCLQQQQVLLSRSTEKMFEEAELSGVLSLAGRKLKEFPSSLFTKYDMSDLVSADLSGNRLVDIPASICELQSLESLRVRGNTLRRIPSNIALLSALTFFDLSNNHLTQLPVALFELPLEILLLTGNRLETIPREIRQLSSTLTELDVSCNHLKSLPADIALLKMLRVLILRQNLLDQFPSELCRLSLYLLDLSSNKFSQLPLHIRKMKTLVDLRINDNPLQSPPASLLAKGQEHIFKWMDVESGGGQQYSVRPLHSTSNTRAQNLGRINTFGVSVADSDITRKSSAPLERRPRTARFHTVGGSDSGYASTADEHRLSHELVACSGLDDITEYTVFSPSSDEGIIVSEQENTSGGTSGIFWPSSNDEPNTGISNKPVNEEDEGGLIALMDIYDKTMATVRTPLEVVPIASESTVMKLTEVLEDTLNSVTPNGNKTQIEHSTFHALDLSNNNSTRIADMSKIQISRSTLPRISTLTSNKPVSKVAPLMNPVRAHSGTSVANISVKTTSSKLSPPSSKSLRKPTLSQNSLISKNNTTAVSARVVNSRKLSVSSVTNKTVNKSRPLSHPVKPSTSTIPANTKSLTRGLNETHSSLTSGIKTIGDPKNDIPITSKKSSLVRNSIEGNITTIDGIRKVFFDRVGIALSSNRDMMLEQLADGIHLCGLVNALKMRSIPTILTPNDNMPLSPAKAKRNVDNFIACCRKFGVPETHICSAADILAKRNPLGISRMVQALMRLFPNPKMIDYCTSKRIFSFVIALLGFSVLIFFVEEYAEEIELEGDMDIKNSVRYSEYIGTSRLMGSVRPEECWRSESYTLLESCVQCSEFEIKAIKLQYCLPTGYFDRLNCSVSGTIGLRPCISRTKNRSTPFYAFTLFNVVVMTISYIIASKRKEQLDRFAYIRVAQQFLNQ